MWVRQNQSNHLMLTSPISPLSYLPDTRHGLNVPRVQVHVLVLEALQHHLQVVRQDGHQVDRVQHAASKPLEVGGGRQAQQVLQGEEGDAERLNVLAIEFAAELARRRLEEKIIGIIKKKKSGLFAE